MTHDYLAYKIFNITVNRDALYGIILLLLIAIIQLYIGERIKTSVMKKIELAKHNLSIKKEWAEDISLLLAEIREYRRNRDMKKIAEINRKIWKLTIWLPSPFLKDMYKILGEKEDVSYKKLLVDIRMYLNQNDKENDYELKHEEIIDLKEIP